MTDSTFAPKIPVTVTLGCDPQVDVTVTETPTGTLFVSIAPTDPTMPIGDIDGVFFDLAQDSTLDALNFFPDANDGSIFSPVTGIQAAVDAVDTLSNGAQVAESYDVGIQFGLEDNSTAGVVPQANFTLFSDNGPLRIEDLDLQSFATVVNSDGGNGQVLTASDGPDDAPVLVSKIVLFEDFDDIHDPADSDAIVRDDNWEVREDQLFTNGSNDGVLQLASVETAGATHLSLDLSVNNLHNFEADGRYADSLRLEVRLDNGDWVLLDEFRVNADGTAMVGSETGNTFDQSPTTLDYSGGILDDGTQTVDFRLVSDISANNEIIRVDNIEVTATEVEDTPAAPVFVEEEVLAEDFNDIHTPDESAAIASDDHWTIENNQLATDGHNDGTLTLETVQSEGPACISFDAHSDSLHRFEAEGRYADSLRLEVQLGDGAWVLLDEFRINADGTALVGSETGNEITDQAANLEYQGGILDGADGDVTFRFVSDISAGDENIYIDNLSVTATQAQDGEGDCVPVTLDFEGFASGDVVDGQLPGVTITAQRDGDDAASQNDAMVFDSTDPTGGDHDLEFADQGNILIISEDNDSSDADDNAQGGTINFAFDDPSDVVSLTLLDIEEAGGTVDLLNADGDLICTLDIPVTGDNEAQELEVDTDGVSSMNVNFVGSGALDDVTFIPPCDVEDPVCEDHQYDVGYVGGLPILPLVEEEVEEEEQPTEVVDFV